MMDNRILLAGGAIAALIVIVIIGALVSIVPTMSIGSTGSAGSSGSPDRIFPSTMELEAPFDSSPKAMDGSVTLESNDPLMQRIEQGDRVQTKSGRSVLEVSQGGLDASLERVKARVADVGGFIENTNFRATESGSSYTLTIRLPPESFDDFALSMKDIGTLKSLDTDVQDVTNQYIDLTTRIENLEKQLIRLQALADRPGVQLDDLLRLENEITRVQTQIESLNATKLNLSRRISRASLTLTLKEAAPLLDSTVILPANQAINLFFGSFSTGILVIAGILGFFIPVLIAGFILYVLGRLIWNRIKGHKKSQAKNLAEMKKP